MEIQSRDSRSTARTIRLTDEEGVTRDVCHVAGSIRDGRSVSIVVDVYDTATVTAQQPAVAAEVMRFVSAVFADAAQTGLPVAQMSEAD